MTVVAVAALVLALIVVLVALSFVRWALRTIARKDAKIDDLRQESMERYARLVGQQIEQTPREKRAELEQDLHQARRDFERARIIEDPEQTIEYGSPSEARVAERMAFEGLRGRADISELDELLADAAREPLFVDIEVDAAR